MINWRRLFFWINYLLGKTPWDTNVTPPELVRTIEGDQALSPGRALDLGCGTGTNVIYLARQGWQAIGVDFVGKAIAEARDKARKAGVDVRFYVGDVTRLNEIEELAETSNSMDLVLDIGCLHSLPAEQHAAYAQGVIDRLRPQGTYLLYAWGPRERNGDWVGLTPAQVQELFEPALRLTHLERGEERSSAANWYWLERSSS
jgi:SAM-dependent methyltransferase